MNKDIEELVEKGMVGFEEYPQRDRGGQQCGIPIIGFRYWYPKDETPDIDIRVRHYRGQLKNKQLAQTLFEMAMEEL